MFNHIILTGTQYNIITALCVSSVILQLVVEDRSRISCYPASNTRITSAETRNSYHPAPNTRITSAETRRSCHPASNTRITSAEARI